jgi:hypothetical protein
VGVREAGPGVAPPTRFRGADLRGAAAATAAGAAAVRGYPAAAPAISLTRHGVIGYKQGFREIGYSVTRH